MSWNAGAADCAATPQPPLQVHRYEQQTYILRQSPCADFEANFIYLLIGSEKALLIDTGAVAEPDLMPLAATVLDFLPVDGGSRLPLLVAHTHGHRDHTAGDPQFETLASVQVISSESAAVRQFFGFTDWPGGIARLDLGDRIVEILPAPGHHPDHLTFYDHRTALLLTGDFLLPGRLLVDDAEEFRASAVRLVEFVETRPIAHVLGAHIELDATGQAFPTGSEHHPNERRLELTKADLLALPAVLQSFNGFYATHANYILSNPHRNLLAVGVAVVAVLALSVWGLLRYLRLRRARSTP
ncbi:MAG: MBL fold metallo-hydrolase [Pseudomonadota bacterium]|nr:MBL fold metallo-hydrolase [Pseudomonadota bacterium]